MKEKIKELNLKKISWKELGFYLKNQCEKEFNQWYSDDVKDYIEDICNAKQYLELTDDSMELTRCVCEITNKNRPLLVEWYELDVFEDDYCTSEYYIFEYYHHGYVEGNSKSV